YTSTAIEPNKAVDPTGVEETCSLTSEGYLASIKHGPYQGTLGFRFTYDVYGQLVGVTDPNDNLTEYDWDGAGNVVSVTNALNETTSIDYDALGRVTNVFDPLMNETEITYTGSGCGTCGGGGQVQSVKRYGTAGNPTVSFQYDVGGRVTKVTDPLGRATDYTYD